MKRLCGVLAIIMLFVTSGFTVMAEQEISVILDGEYLTFDVPPQIINGRTMLPARAIIEAIGAEVQWDEETQTVTATKEDKSVSFVINQAVMKVNEISIEIDSPACIVNDRTLVPVRALSTAFGMIVGWDDSTRTVTLHTSDGLSETTESVSPYPEYVPNTESFEKVKNKIITDGKYNSGYYSIDVLTDNAEGVYASLSLLYYPDTDNISWYVYGWDGVINIDAYYSIYNQSELSPSVMASIEHNGAKYSKYGIFMNSTHLLKTIESDVPQEYIQLVDEWICVSAETFNRLMQEYKIDVTMQDFGIVVDETIYQ